MQLPSIDDVIAARAALRGVAIRTPLVRFDTEGLDQQAGPRIWLKLENLQPIGSFKLRGAAAVLAHADAGDVATGVVTASAGNMGQGAAWFAKRLGVPCTVLVPPTAPDSKIAAMEALGAKVIRVTHDQWWTAFVDRRADGIDGVFIHAFDDPRVMAGNGTIAMEILDDLPETTAIVAPWGGGGLSCGIAAAAQAIAPHVRVYAAEVATAAPYRAARAAGAPVTVDMQPSFVDGIGSRTVLASMYERAAHLDIGALRASVDEVRSALVAMLERNHVLAEGAGATPLACVLGPDSPFTSSDEVVCVVSGGTLDRSILRELLAD